MDVQGLSAAIAAHFAGLAVRGLLFETRAEEPEIVALRIECRAVASGGYDTDFEYLNRSGQAVGGGTL